MDCIRIVQKYCMDICHMKVKTTGSEQISSHFMDMCLFMMVLISESHVFISWMHVFWNADTGFGTNPNINTKNGGILHPKSLHIGRNICQLWKKYPINVYQVFVLFTCKLKSVRICGMILELPTDPPIMPQRLRQSYYVNTGRGKSSLTSQPWVIYFQKTINVWLSLTK